ncbi:tetratricopeptide repeat protein [Streptacidiphilus sp. PAMC 29251]
MTDQPPTGDARYPDPRRIATRSDFGRELTALRLSSQLSVRQLAKASDIPASTLGGYFAGTHLPALQPPDLLSRVLCAAGTSDPAVLEEWRLAYLRVKQTGSEPSGHLGDQVSTDRPTALHTAAGVTPVTVSTRPPLERLDAEPSIRGRDRLLDLLASIVAGATQMQDDPRIHVLHGLGGCGKSLVALSAVRSAAQIGVRTWWIAADDAATVTGGMFALATELGASPDRLRLGSLPDILWRQLQELDEPWLLVLDNVDDPPHSLALTGHRVTDGTGWLRPTGQAIGTIVVTTRDGSRTTWGTNQPDWIRLHRIGTLGREDGARVLLELAGRTAGTPADAAALSTRLGGLPLGLALAGRYLAESLEIPPGLGPPELPRSFTDYREALGRGGHEDLLTPARGATPATRRAHATIGRTWELSIDLLRDRGLGEARPLLQTLACLGSAPIPYGLLLRADVLAASPLFAGVSVRGAWDALRGLEELGLVGLVRNDEHDLLTIHTLVRDVSRRHPEVRQHVDHYLSLTTALLTPVVEAVDPKSPSAWERWRLLADHCAAPLDLISEHDVGHSPAWPTALRLANRAASYLRAAGHLAEAKSACASALDAARRRSSEDDPLVLHISHEFARVRYDQGRLAEAEGHFRAVLSTRAAVLGPEHPDTFTTRHYLARTLRDRGRTEEAAALFAETLQARLRLLGENHPDTLTSSNGVADILRAQGRWTEALAAYQRVLERRTQVLGERHPATLVTRQYLAEVRQELEQFEVAEAELHLLVAANRDVRGADHPRTLAVRQSLVNLLHDTGRQEEARVSALPLVASRRRVLGDAHPATLHSRYRLGLILLDLGATDEAEAEIWGVLIDRQRVLGLMHPHTLLAQETLEVVRQRSHRKAAVTARQ